MDLAQDGRYEWHHNEYRNGGLSKAENFAFLQPESHRAFSIWPSSSVSVAPQVTFLLADEDKSGGLSEAEHFAFLHPEDSSSVALHAHLRKQDIIDRDRNHDNKCAQL